MLRRRRCDWAAAFEKKLQCCGLDRLLVKPRAILSLLPGWDALIGRREKTLGHHFVLLCAVRIKIPTRLQEANRDEPAVGSTPGRFERQG